RGRSNGSGRHRGFFGTLDTPAGSAGALWFDEMATPGGAMGRITTSGSLADYSLPNHAFSPRGVGATALPDGSLYVAVNNPAEILKATAATPPTFTTYSLTNNPL